MRTQGRGPPKNVLAIAPPRNLKKWRENWKEKKIDKNLAYLPNFLDGEGRGQNNISAEMFHMFPPPN